MPFSHSIKPSARSHVQERVCVREAVGRTRVVIIMVRMVFGGGSVTICARNYAFHG